MKDFLSPLLLDTAKAVQATREGEEPEKARNSGTATERDDAKAGKAK